MQLELPDSHEVHPQVKELLSLALSECHNRGLTTFDEKDFLIAIVNHERNGVNSFLRRKYVPRENVLDMPHTDDPSFQEAFLKRTWEEASELKSKCVNPDHVLLALLTFPLVIEHLQVKPHWRRSIMRMLGYF